MKESMAFRVIDEQQVDRHFSANDIAELYKLNPAPLPSKDAPQRLEKPEDKLLAKLFEVC